MPVFAVRNLPKSMSILGGETLNKQINRHPFLYSRLHRFRKTANVTGETSNSKSGGSGGGDSIDATPHFGNDELNVLHNQIAAAVKAADQQRSGKRKVVSNKIYFEQLRPIVTAKCGISMQRFMFRQQQKATTKLSAHNSEPAFQTEPKLASGPKNYFTARNEIRRRNLREQQLRRRRRAAAPSAATLFKSILVLNKADEDGEKHYGTEIGLSTAAAERKHGKVPKFKSAKLNEHMRQLLEVIDNAVDKILTTMASTCLMLTRRRVEQTGGILRRFIRYELLYGDILTNLTAPLMKKLLGLDDESGGGARTSSYSANSGGSGGGERLSVGRSSASDRTSAEKLQDIEFFMRFSSWMRDIIEPLSITPGVLALRAHLAAIKAVQPSAIISSPIDSTLNMTNSFGEKFGGQAKQAGTFRPLKRPTRLPSRTARPFIQQQQARRLRAKYSRLQPRKLFDFDSDPFHAPAVAASRKHRAPPTRSGDDEPVAMNTGELVLTSPELRTAQDAGQVKMKTSFRKLDDKYNPETGFQRQTDVYKWTLPFRKRLAKNLNRVVDFSFGYHILHNEIVHQMAYEKLMEALDKEIAEKSAQEQTDSFWPVEQAARMKHRRIRTWTGDLI